MWVSYRPAGFVMLDWIGFDRDYPDYLLPLCTTVLSLTPLWSLSNQISHSYQLIKASNKMRPPPNITAYPYKYSVQVLRTSTPYSVVLMHATLVPD